MCGPQNEGGELHLKQTQGNQPDAPDLHLSKEKCIVAFIPFSENKDFIFTVQYRYLPEARALGLFLGKAPQHQTS